MNNKHWLAALSALIFAFILVACEQEEITDPAEPEETPDEVAEEDCHLTMGWDPWEPYQYYTPRGEVSGLDVELVQAAAERVGCELSFEQDNFARLLNRLRAGELDFLPGATRTEARERFARFSIPYRDETFAIWVRKDDQDLYADATLESLLQDRRRVGYTEGFIYGEEAETLMADPDYEDLLVSARIGDLNMLRLVEHDIDAMIEDPFVAASVQRRLGVVGELSRLGQELYSTRVRLMFSRETVDEELVAAFDEALEALIEDGTWERISEQYSPED